METISQQGQQFCGNRFAAAPLRQTLKNIGSKNFYGNDGNLRNNCFAGYSSSQTQQDIIDENVLSVKGSLLSKDGFASVVPLEHPLVTAYISSCQQGNCMIYVSQQKANLGFTPEAWLGETDLRLQQVHKDDSGRFTQALQHTLSTGGKFNCHYRLYDSSGKVRWFHDEASVVRDESGMPLFIRGVMLDITDKKEMEAELHGHRHHLERHVDMRTKQLMKRIALLESCNASLSNKLALTQAEFAALKQQLAASDMQAEQAAQAIPAAQIIQAVQPDDCTGQLDGISDWARNMIGWRVAATGEIA